MAEGIVCGLTSLKPSFEENCISFNLDQEEKEKVEEAKRLTEEAQLKDDTMGLSSFGVKSMSLAGWIVISISIIWFLGGFLFLSSIFFYPIILLVLGIITVVKGNRKRNKSIPKHHKKDILDSDFTS